MTPTSAAGGNGHALTTVPARGLRMPRTYEEARIAIEVCARVDECKEWEDLAAAAEIYYRQKKDVVMEATAKRIRLRAATRYGEVLRQIDREEKAAREAEKQAVGPSGLGGTNGRVGRGSDPLASSRVATAAGISPKEVKEAKRMASVRPETRDALIERQKPATKAEILRHAPPPARKPVDVLRGRDPKEFKIAMNGCAALDEFVREVRELDASTVSHATLASEFGELRKNIREARAWLVRLEKAMKKGGWRS